MTITVTPTLEAGNVPPRVRLDIVSTGTATTAVTVARVDEDGTTRPVRTADGNSLTLTLSGSNMTGLIYDYEMPFGTSVTYGTVEGGASGSPLFVAVADCWLVHPGVPDRSVRVGFRITSFDETSNDVSRGVFYPIGRSRPIVVTDGQRKDDDGQFTVGTETLSELAGLRALLADTSTLLLQVPPTLGLGVATNYIAAGRVTVRRRSSIGSDPYRDVTIPFVVVDRPTGGSQSERTWADVMAESATWAEVLATHPTWAELLAPTT